MRRRGIHSSAAQATCACRCEGMDNSIIVITAPARPTLRHMFEACSVGGFIQTEVGPVGEMRRRARLTLSP